MSCACNVAKSIDDRVAIPVQAALQKPAEGIFVVERQFPLSVPIPKAPSLQNRRGIRASFALWPNVTFNCCGKESSGSAPVALF